MDCKHVGKLSLFPVANQSIVNPREWSCSSLECGTTESVWACLSCNSVACGRYIAEHALKHFTKHPTHPLAIEVNLPTYSITILLASTTSKMLLYIITSTLHKIRKKPNGKTTKKKPKTKAKLVLLFSQANNCFSISPFCSREFPRGDGLLQFLEG